MQVNLDDSTNINVEKIEDSENYILSVDGRTRMIFSKSELKFINALIDSALKEDTGQSRESLRDSLKEAVSRNSAKLQKILLGVDKEDLALAIWYADSEETAEELYRNMSKRSVEAVQEAVRETVERRIRKERSLGNKDIEKIVTEEGRAAAASFLKKLIDA